MGKKEARLFEGEYREEKLNQGEEQREASDQLEKKITQIMLRLEEIRFKIVELKNSELHQLMMKVRQAKEQGQDLLDEMATNLRQQIAGAKELLNNLKLQEKG